MEYLDSSLTPLPGLIKTTVYLLPAVDQTIKALPYHTRTAAVNGVFLALGRQQRQLPGVGPRELREFAAHLGIDDTLPPEYHYTARERETMRVERNRYVGLPTKAETARIRAEIEARRASLAMAEVAELVQAAEVAELVQAAEVAELVQAEEVAELVQAEEVPEPVRFEKAPTRREASLCSEKLSELVALAALYCAPALDRALDRAQGRTLEALESELTSIVEMNRPEHDNLSRRRLRRDMS